MTRAWLRIAFAATLIATGAARAELVPVCFNYGCTTLSMVRFGPAELDEVGRMFAGAVTAQAERAAIAQAMGRLYFHAALQTPTWRDRGGNIDDEGMDGRMDCIDHSTNTTTYLALLERNGWLRFHSVAGPVQRGRFLAVHWGAQLRENGGEARWIVDTCFYDPGSPATIYTLDEWLDGARPPGAALVRF
jgi:hypothetical protein